jgi:hypothetical protein
LKKNFGVPKYNDEPMRSGSAGLEGIDWVMTPAVHINARAPGRVDRTDDLIPGIRIQRRIGDDGVDAPIPSVAIKEMIVSDPPQDFALGSQR